jgi:hypothetical protein
MEEVIHQQWNRNRGACTSRPAARPDACSGGLDAQREAKKYASITTDVATNTVRPSASVRFMTPNAC